jgi:dienelactone hydrolase
MANRTMAFLLFGVLTVPAQAQESVPKPIGEEAYRAVISFFDYERTIPLDVKVLSTSRTQSYVREKIVFTGGRGDRVPGYLATPTSGTLPYPVVLTMHAGATSKETWWEEDSFEHGGKLTEGLLASGIAVLSLDAQYHGERSFNNDFLSIYEMYFEKEWMIRYRDMMIESTQDYLRALDYLESRTEIDRSRIGVIGHSMGGMMTIYLSALSPSVRSAVVCIGAAYDARAYPVNPINFARSLGEIPILVLAGRTDPLIPAEATELFFGLIDGDSKRLEFFDSGHQLPEEYVDRALAWFRETLR